MANWTRRSLLFRAATSAAAIGALAQPAMVLADDAADPLSSWNDGPAKNAITDFIAATTDRGSAHFVEPENRIATFDQDGTLWCEQPAYAQAVFVLERARALLPQHPEWKNQPSLMGMLAGDVASLKAATEEDWAKLTTATHGGVSVDAFAAQVATWMRTAKHPRFKKRYTELVYQPMLDVLSYFRNNGYKTYIVTGGGQEFVRVYSQRVYGIPSERIVGSYIGTKYVYAGGKPELLRLNDLVFSDNGPGKVVGINLFIGKRPYAAFGNSTGDQQMLEWTGAGSGARLKMLVLHDDAQREYAYGPANHLPNSKIGTFSVALMAEAKAKDWTVISMKNDWKRIFPE